MEARTKRSIQEMTYWYNLTPKEGLNDESSPSTQLLYSYKWRCKGEPMKCEEYKGKAFLCGESVFVKPTNPKCTTSRRQGMVTKQLSPTSIEVDGRPHHIGDIRKVNEIKKNLEGTD